MENIEDEHSRKKARRAADADRRLAESKKRDEVRLFALNYCLPST